MYFGLIEIVLSFGGAIAFYIWQRRTLARDMAKWNEEQARISAGGGEPQRSELDVRNRRTSE
jgi:hypothetical protein